jgi:hypothetical protein
VGARVKSFSCDCATSEIEELDDDVRAADVTVGKPEGMDTKESIQNRVGSLDL